VGRNLNGFSVKRHQKGSKATLGSQERQRACHCGFPHAAFASNNEDTLCREKVVWFHK
jgi:hypothetical protein